MAISLNVNGKAVSVEAEPDTPLLWVLREDVGLTGTKFGCGVAACGACSVHVDGQIARSCSIPIADVAGKSVTTIEGLKSAEGTLHKVQQAWIDAQVPQCGYASRVRSWRGGADQSDRQSQRCADRRSDDKYLPLRHLSAHQEGNPCRDR